MATHLELVKSATLPYLLSLPRDAPSPLPVLCFLHGLDEGPPTDIFEGITRHGPLRKDNPVRPAETFLVASPQLPVRGDHWRFHAREVIEIVRQVQSERGGDPERTCLTGFSFGGNGVFDLALNDPSFWAALWPVDPTRVPTEDPGLPVWLSGGEASRYALRRFIERLGLKAPDDSGSQNRIFLDQGLDHTGTASSAYADQRIYEWLLTKKK